MNFEPLLHAPLAIQIHVATVVPAAIIGPVLFSQRKGTRLHKAFGRVWMALMAITAISTFFIHEINLVAGFSPIHILSLLVLFGCIRAVVAARVGQISLHREIVKKVYLGGIVGAGFFAFMPGRIMYAVAFSDRWKSPLLIVFMVPLALLLGLLWGLKRFVPQEK